MLLCPQSLISWSLFLGTGVCQKISVTPEHAKGDWLTKKCSLDSAGNTGKTNVETWIEADAAGAWEYITSLPYDGSMDWTSFVARESNYTTWREFQCQQLVGGTTCTAQEACVAPITPGGWMVVTSIVNMWGVRNFQLPADSPKANTIQYHWDLYTLVQTAHSQIDVDLVVNNFSPQFDTASYLEHELFLTSLTFGLSMAIGAIFNIGRSCFPLGRILN